MAKQKEEWNNEENEWYQKARQTAQTLMDRPAFSYAPERDTLYQAAKQTAIEQGRRAMEDTLGKAAGLSGGYASSYAQGVGAQAYDRQLSQLRSVLPEYYDRARANYDRQTDELRDTLSVALGLYDKDYQRWLDRQSALEREAEAERKQSQWEAETEESRRRWEAETAESQRRWDTETQEDKRRWEAETREQQRQWLKEFAEGHDRWTAEYQQNERKLAAQTAKQQQDALLAEQKLAAEQAKDAAARSASAAEKQKSYAYRMAILALQQGLSVSDALLKTAGIDKAYAESLRRYYAYRR